MLASDWQFELLANVGVDADVVGALELVLAALELEPVLDPPFDPAAWLELVLDPPLDPPQPATSAATASSATKNFTAITSPAPAGPGTEARP
jgi:hypothetical protein